jgi:aconitase A
MNTKPRDAFGARQPLATPGGTVHVYRLDALAAQLGVDLAKLPFSIRVLLEAALRQCDDYQVTRDDVTRLARWQPTGVEPVELPFKPARVILQDFTGVPCVVDLAAMREAVHRMGADPRRINPLVPVDLVIDHSVQVDLFGTRAALEKNAEIEFERNKERYEFLRWGQKAFANFRVVPPATGIVHQVNLEYLAGVTLTQRQGDEVVAYPDTLVGTDSHTTMINGLGVVGWGVGGIEAEAVMLGQPLYLLTPQVVGFKLTGRLRDGVTATDLVLTVTQMLRKKGVVDKFVEFYGPGLSAMSLPDRATIGNMSPEFGATIGFFPVDDETLRYLERTNRGDAARLTEAYYKAQGMFRTDATPDPTFSDTLELDLATVEASLAGPKRPQDRVALRDVKTSFRKGLTAPVKERGFGLAESELANTATVQSNGHAEAIGHGAVVIAAITSCTNTSNPSVMLGAGLLARKAVAKGLRVKPHVKTSMAPGSKVVTEYLKSSGTMTDLEALGFHVVGYGCTTCIAAGTPVLLADGTSRRIEEFPMAGGESVLGPDRNGRLVRALQTEKMIRGLRDCVTVVLEDGRELTCTPDHEILTRDGRWVRADELVLGHDRVVVAADVPHGPGADSAGHALEAGAVRLETSQLGTQAQRSGSTVLFESAEHAPQDQGSFPTIDSKVVDRRPAGKREVYDLSVADTHAFVANGIAVHNCIGNSGPLPEEVAKAVDNGKLVAAAVLSGNRNFEGRVNPLTRANYLASPPLVVAYALAGRVDVDFDREPLGEGADGKPVFLRDIWPSQDEIAKTISASLQPAMFAKSYGNVFDGNPRWNEIPVAGGERYVWSKDSTYIHEPPFFLGLTPEPGPVSDITGARCLVMLGDSVTTDHISPAGDIALASPAGRWLQERGIEKRDFNSYGSRRGHDQVMMRGTFANIRLKNLLVPGSEGNVTVHFPSGEQVSIFDASVRYQDAGTPLVVLAGKEYGSGSSRDWAAKGTLMLGVRAVLAESFERIHRSNLVGMGVLPLVYEPGQGADSLGLTGRETFELTGLAAGLKPRQRVTVRAKREDGSVLEFTAIARLDTPVDVDYYRNGGILQTVLRNLVKG